MYYIKNFEREADKFDERYGMKKIYDFIKDISKDNVSKMEKQCCNKCSTFKNVNIGYTQSKVIFEIGLPGYKKENIKVSYNGCVVTIIATYEENDTPINYVVNNLKHDIVSKKFKLDDKFSGGIIKWKFTDGLLLIAVESDSDETVNITASDDDEDIISETGEESGQNDNTQNIP